MNSEQMGQLLLHQNFKNIPENKGRGPNTMKAIFSDVGDLQKTSDKLMFSLIKAKFPGQYDESQ